MHPCPEGQFWGSEFHYFINDLCGIFKNHKEPLFADEVFHVKCWLLHYFTVHVAISSRYFGCCLSVSLYQYLYSYLTDTSTILHNLNNQQHHEVTRKSIIGFHIKGQDNKI